MESPILKISNNYQSMQYQQDYPCSACYSFLATGFGKTSENFLSLFFFFLLLCLTQSSLFSNVTLSSSFNHHCPSVFDNNHSFLLLSNFYSMNHSLFLENFFFLIDNTCVSFLSLAPIFQSI